MWQLGQMAETMSTSRDSSTDHPVLPEFAGRGLDAPFSLRMVRQPAPVLAMRAGSLHDDR
jgi:hypothetical protein